MNVDIVNHNEFLSRGVSSFLLEKYKLAPRIHRELYSINSNSQFVIYCGDRTKDYPIELLDVVNQSVAMLVFADKIFFRTNGNLKFESFHSMSPKLMNLIVSAIKSHKFSPENSLKNRRKLNPTKRELQVLKFMARGFLNKEIAEHLRISIETVKTHRKNLKRKLGLKTQMEYIEYCDRYLI